jgi:hypothetical protein
MVAKGHRIMKFLRIVLVVALLGSLAANAFFWQRLSQQQTETEATRAAAAEAEALRAENEALKKQTVTPSGNAEENRELARLRNEVGQLRKQAGEAAAQQAKESAQLRSQLANATQNLAQKEKEAEVLKVTAEQADQAQQAKQRTQFIACMNNLKQIGLAARIWANDHGNVFPPDLLMMKNELVTPKVLVCPAAPPAAQPAGDWTQFNSAMISYQYMNANGSLADPQKVLTMCPIHGHVGLSDGSVQAKRLQP